MTVLRSPAPLGALALAGLGTALWVEHRSRDAERRHHAPHHILYIDGTRLHYHLVGEGPPVLLVHGNLVHGADFEASGLVERLAERYQVLVIDRPGFGHSDRQRGVAWTPARQARLLHKAAEALGIRRPVVVGHSLGAQVALAMALQQPASVAGLVLVSGYYWPSFRLDRWMAAPAAVPVLGDLLRYTTSALTARATLGATLKAIFDPAPIPESFTQLLPREMLLRPLQQRATAEDGSHMVAQALALKPHYATLRTPVTVIAGTEDRIVSPRQTVRLHEAVPRARLRLLDGVGHMAHWQAHEQILGGIADALGADRTDPLVRGTVATVQPPSAAASATQDTAPAVAFPTAEQRP
jgi:pimeloyl-ACP methyl ester carboxylesterase